MSKILKISLSLIALSIALITSVAVMVGSGWGGTKFFLIPGFYFGLVTLFFYIIYRKTNKDIFFYLTTIPTLFFIILNLDMFSKIFSSLWNVLLSYF